MTGWFGFRGLIRILDLDLAAAGIPKIDEQGRRLDVTKAVNSLPATP